MQKNNASTLFLPSLKAATPISVACLLALLFSNNLLAACAREDVSFYLKQGFNHEQIVKLCATQDLITQQPVHSPRQKPQSAQIKVLQHNNSAPRYRHEASGIYGNPDAVFLATAIEAYNVEVTEKAIIFSRKDCFNYGQEDWNEFQDRACPNVKYTINRGDLKIVDRDNGFFGIGSTALFISGNITAEILDLDQFKNKHHKAIKAIIHKNTEKLKVNVRSGMPQGKVEAILLKLAG